MTIPDTKSPNTQQQVELRYPVSIRAVSAVLAVLSALLAILSTIEASRQPTAQFYTIAIGFWVLFIISALSFSEFLSSNENTRFYILIATLELVLLLIAVLVEGTGLTIALMFLLGRIVAVSIASNRQYTDRSISAGIGLATLAIVLNLYAPLRQIVIPAFQIYVPVILGILVMGYIMLISMEFMVATLQVKLISAALTIVLVPLILLSLIETSFIQTSLQNQTKSSLIQAARQTADAVDAFIGSNRSTIEQEAELPIFRQYLQMDPRLRAGSTIERQLKLTLNSLLTKERSEFASYGVLSSWGVNVYDSNPAQSGFYEGRTEYYRQSGHLGQAYASSLIFSPINNDPYIYFSAPIRDEDQNVIGVLRLRYDGRVLQNILQEHAGQLGTRSYPMLLDDNLFRLGDTMTPQSLYKAVVPIPPKTVIELRQNRLIPAVNFDKLSTNIPSLAGALRNYQTRPIFNVEFHENDAAVEHDEETATAVQLKSKPWIVVYSQESSVLNNLLKNQQNLVVTITALLAGFVGILATMLSRLFSRPIIDLTYTAERISRGDLEAQAIVDRNDELGTLGNAFNLMTHRLREFISDLEERVRARTQELAEQNETLRYRGQQLQTVADVARGIATTQSLQSLLTQVTVLISERFDFYHVGIFLIDENNDYAILRAANSAGGQRMLARQHKLRVGQTGIVGYVSAVGQPRIATDVGKDAVYFNNPDLPLTRSEMALPLRSGDKIIGALDVQSTQSNVFTQEDIELFSTLADQVAIAILNNRLFEETNRALEEAQRVHRQYLRAEWGKSIGDRTQTAYVYNQQGLHEQAAVQDNPEILQALQTGQTVTQQQKINAPGQTIAMAVPITLRGQTIGVIHLEDQTTTARSWSPEEMATVRSVADQVAQAIENARLFEQTVRRAERERRVLEISNKIRSANDPQVMLQVAVQELKNALNASRAQIILQNEPGEAPQRPQNGNGHSTEPISTSPEGQLK